MSASPAAPMSGPPTIRTETFSDGVLAIAITLLVLELRVPSVKPGDTLADALLDMWPKYAVFAISFVTIGIMWINHHVLFDRVAFVDRRLQFCNLFLLLTIVFVPFPTAVLGDYVREGENAKAAAALYGVNLFLVGVGFMLLWLHLAHRPHQLKPPWSRSDVDRALRRTVIGPATYGLGVVLSFASAWAALTLYGALVVYFSIGQISRMSPAAHQTASVGNDSEPGQ
jgi:uncharacterized membrane protein